MRPRVHCFILAALAPCLIFAQSPEPAAPSGDALVDEPARGERIDEAVTAYRSALDREPKNSSVRLALARIFRDAGQNVEARMAARAVLEYDPLNDEARQFLAELPGAETGLPRGGTPARLVSARSRGNARSTVDQAVAEAYASGRAEKFAHAAELLEEELRRDPRNHERRKALAYLYLEKLRDPASAVPHLEKVVAAEPTDSGWLQMLARAEVAVGNRRAAVELYGRAAAAAPRDVWARYHLGCTLRDLGEHRRAEAAFREALSLEPGNVHVRRELARSLQATGHATAAVEMARAIIADNPADAETHALLGELYRKNRDYHAASIAYHAALASDPAHPVAAAGMRAVEMEKRPKLKLAFYTFDDTDGLRQSGIFTHLSTLVSGPLQASAYLNERFFRKAPEETSERFEAGLGLTYRLHSAVQISGGINQFKTENRERETGGYFAFYVTPVSAFDFALSYRHADPVNDSYITAREAFTQNSFSAELHFRPARTVTFDVTASTSDYSDGNTRRFGLASLAWYLALPASPVVRLEYEWLDFAEHTRDYSSPDNYGRLRPVLEISPQLTSWLKLEFHGELSYVFDEDAWGTGFTVGPRFQNGERFELGIAYMKYAIPGGQTTWSGDGVKVDLSWRF